MTAQDRCGFCSGSDWEVHREIYFLWQITRIIAQIGQILLLKNNNDLITFVYRVYTIIGYYKGVIKIVMLHCGHFLLPLANSQHFSGPSRFSRMPERLFGFGSAGRKFGILNSAWVRKRK